MFLALPAAFDRAIIKIQAGGSDGDHPYHLPLGLLMMKRVLGDETPADFEDCT